MPRFALAFALLSNVAIAAEPSSPSFASLFGRWKAVRILAHGDITATNKQARAVIGTIVTISANKISDTYGPSAACAPQTPTITYEDTESKLNQDFGTFISDVRLPQGTLKARMPFLDAVCAGGLIINENEMMWAFGNGFYYLIERQGGPAKPYAQP